MGLIWEIYNKARQGNDPNFQEVLAYASRDSFKTLSASIIELLCLVHLKRDVVHLAAVERQSKICLDYINSFFKRPVLREYISALNKRNLVFTRYEAEDGTIISPVQYNKLEEEEKDKYNESQNSIAITVATVEAANGLHAPFMCVTGCQTLYVQNYGEISVKDYADALVKDHANPDLEYETEPNRDVAKFFKIAGRGLPRGALPETLDTMSSPVKYDIVTRVAKKKDIVLQVNVRHRTFVDDKIITYDSSIKCTKNHRILAKNLETDAPEWVEAKDLQPKQELVGINPWSQVSSVKMLGADWVYDFAVSNIQNFICNGIFVHNCMDELDIAPPAAFMEAKSIPTQTRGDNKYPITLMTSTRKYSFGLVQKEIDKAHETGLNIRFWNLLDVTQICPPTRHLPEEPTIDIYVNQEILSAISENQFENLPESEQRTYHKKVGYAGCLKNCKLFSSCLGRLATHQKSTSPLLKPVDVTQKNILKVSLEHACAQYLCRKPSAAGLVFPTFERARHVKPAYELAQMVTGEEYPKSFSKGDFIQLCQDLNLQFVSGIDWGFTHFYSVVTGVIANNILIIFDVINETEKEIFDRIEITRNKIGHLRPRIYPDNAYPSDIRTFQKVGFTMIHFEKDTLASIDAARKRLYPGANQKPTMFLLDNDPGVELLIKQISMYHWKMDKDGELTDEPDKVDDDVLDAWRYLVQNTGIEKTVTPKKKEPPKIKTSQDVQAEFFKNKVRELTGENYRENPSELSGDPNFKFSF
jgi:hypothetical protein